MGESWSDCANCSMPYTQCKARSLLGDRCCKDCKHTRW